jgi:hypothetical protein
MKLPKLRMSKGLFYSLLLLLMAYLCSCGTGRNGYGCPSSRKLGDTYKTMKY